MGDIFPGDQSSSINITIPQEILHQLQTLEGFIDLWSRLLNLAIAQEIDPQLKSDLLDIARKTNKKEISQVEEALFTATLLLDAYNLGTFIPESDLVVSVPSQTAGLSRYDKQVSVFDNFVWHAYKHSIVDRKKVGKKVIELLNTATNEPGLFGDIPASANKNSINNPFGGMSGLETISTSQDTNKLAIVSPEFGLTTQVNNVVKIQLALKDTVNLISLKVWFQDKLYHISERTAIINLNTQVNGNFLDNQVLRAEAFYWYDDSALFVIQETEININSTSTLEDFQADPTIIYLYQDETQHPEYIARFEDFTTDKGNFSRSINAIVADTNIVRFDSLSKGFTGVEEGETYAVVSYRNLVDTIFFVVNGQLDTTLSTSITEPFPIPTDDKYILNYPNPFSNHTQIDLEMVRPGKVILEVFSLAGARMTIREEIIENPGKHTLDFYGQDLPDGIYLFKLHTPAKTWNGKMVKIGE